MGSLTRRSSQKTLKRDKVIGGGGGSPPSISGPVLVNTEDMHARMQRLGCVRIGSGNDVILNNNNNTTKPTRNGVDQSGLCDSCSIDTTLTEYCLPADYVLGTFPKDLLESRVPSRQNSVSSCTHGRRSNSSSTCDVPTSMNRLSVYDNLSDDEQTPPLTALVTPTTQARKELDAVLHDLLINITNLDLDSGLASRDSFKPADAVEAVDSAVVSPTSEELSSLPSDTPVDSPEQRRRCSGGEEEATSSEELSTSLEHMVEEDETGEEAGEEAGDMRQMQETIWRERRDSGVGSSLTREPT